jgi:hypothetical protein
MTSNSFNNQAVDEQIRKRFNRSLTTKTLNVLRSNDDDTVKQNELSDILEKFGESFVREANEIFSQVRDAIDNSKWYCGKCQTFKVISEENFTSANIERINAQQYAYCIECSNNYKEASDARIKERDARPFEKYFTGTPKRENYAELTETDAPSDLLFEKKKEKQTQEIEIPSASDTTARFLQALTNSVDLEKLMKSLAPPEVTLTYIEAVILSAENKFFGFYEIVPNWITIDTGTHRIMIAVTTGILEASQIEYMKKNSLSLVIK